MSSGATPRRRQRWERSATCGLRAQADLAPGSALGVTEQQAASIGKLALGQ
ncbi:MAG: hypothetical protein WBA93_16870 [Microcoleaceae cyanobacterium]